MGRSPSSTNTCRSSSLRRTMTSTTRRFQHGGGRGARRPIVLLTDSRGASDNESKAFDTIRMPEADPFISPFLYTIPVQLLAYHAAVAIGTDVDQPRNLAKSVTVE